MKTETLSIAPTPLFKRQLKRREKGQEATRPRSSEKPQGNISNYLLLLLVPGGITRMTIPPPIRIDTLFLNGHFPYILECTPGDVKGKEETEKGKSHYNADHCNDPSRQRVMAVSALWYRFYENKES